MKVFLGLREVTGTYRNLKLGLEMLGVPCTFIDLLDHNFKYGGNDNGRFVRLMLWCKQRGGFWRLLEAAILRRLLFIWALATHDVFIFASTTSFFRDFSDQKILKFFGKRIIHQFHGTDCRPPYINGAVVNDTDIDAAGLISRTRHLKRVMQSVERYADVLINIPPQAHFHERPYINRLWLGRPLKIDVPDLKTSPNERVRLLHCPSRLRSKGTLEIREAVESLKASGLDFDFVEISGQPNTVVMAELARCDVVVDQLYSDYPLPGLATEAAWFGKPTVVGGYAQALWDEVLPAERTPPSLYCKPEALEDALSQMINDATARQSLGAKARAFVESQWQLQQVAARYLQVIRGEYPAEWVCDPADLDYLWGCALSAPKLRQTVAEVIRLGGVESLRLDDKPDLRRAFEQLAADTALPCVQARQE